MPRFLSTAVAIAAFATPVFADTAPNKVESGTYAVEPNHTQVVFSVNHFGFSTFSGLFEKASGTLVLDPVKPEGSKLDVTVSTDSVYTPSDKLTGELKGADWLDAGKFPEITFKSTKVEKTGPESAKVMGDLTLHGVTKPVTLTAKFHGAGPNPLSKKYTIGFEVSGKIKRSDFGVKTYVPMIGDEVDLTINAPFEKQG
jgi:polyisoprenoid-binding protein YceI